ncbi:class I SAM-dependent methyltransferase [Paenibacillus flagellatus]|uniref:SAM-dependent methyltransferase n=1 Tax=Paenibacillus flagellatus TaxID=2211139 RepID=A0A2V5K8S6_9BACL|nr:class I SAM-dependent methyltransferase [Paenibacillus flagellatus]PYI55935.1 SAM-dependent methyltransferase [Paenibacillus flagellatus]
MLVTTSYSPSPEAAARAKAIAGELRCRYVERGTSSVRRLGERYGDSRFLVVTERELQFHSGGETPLFFHPSLSLVRVKRLMNGEHDGLIEASGAAVGDAVLDCTAGLGSDAIVFSYAVGEEGAVTAVESEPALYTVVREGLASYQTFSEPFDAAMRRVRLVLGHHLETLRGMPDDSVDIVYFDPMFRQPVEESSAIGPLRQVANHSPLSEEAIREAVRVARKSVVMKEHRDSGEFERLGFGQPARTRTKIAYGVIHP